MSTNTSNITTSNTNLQHVQINQPPSDHYQPASNVTRVVSTSGGNDTRGALGSVAAIVVSIVFAVFAAKLLTVSVVASLFCIAASVVILSSGVYVGHRYQAFRPFNSLGNRSPGIYRPRSSFGSSPAPAPVSVRAPVLVRAPVIQTVNNSTGFSSTPPVNNNTSFSSTPPLFVPNRSVSTPVNVGPSYQPRPPVNLANSNFSSRQSSHIPPGPSSNGPSTYVPPQRPVQSNQMNQLPHRR